jgi:Zn-finger nucleic acid-binding protein
MANYNTFVVINCKNRNLVLVTSSARKAYKELKTGVRIEVWNDNSRLERIYEHDKRKEANPFKPYMDLEREYIQKKQQQAEMKNKRRKQKAVWSGGW